MYNKSDLVSFNSFCRHGDHLGFGKDGARAAYPDAVRSASPGTQALFPHPIQGNLEGAGHYLQESSGSGRAFVVDDEIADRSTPEEDDLGDNVELF